MEIKLDRGLPYEGSPAQAFMKKFEESSVAHPLHNNARVLDNCQVECRPSDGNRGIHLSDIRSFAKGAGTVALHHLCSIADLFGTPISLVAKGYADTPTSALVRWYVENGFVSSGFGSDNDGYRMKREPKRIMKLGGDTRVIKLTGFKYSGTDEDDDDDDGYHDDDDDYGYHDNDEDLYEAKIIQAGDIKVWKNPSGRELIAIANTLGHDLRGLVSRDDVFVWDAMLAIHGTMANSLGLSRMRPAPFYVSTDSQNISEVETWAVFDGLVGRLRIYVNKLRMLDFHECSGYTRMKRVRGLFG